MSKDTSNIFCLTPTETLISFSGWHIAPIFDSGFKHPTWWHGDYGCCNGSLSLLDAFEVRIRTDFDPSHVHVGVSAGPAWDPFRPGGAASSVRYVKSPQGY